MKGDIGEVARRIAPYVAGVTAEDEAEKLALSELRLCTPDRLIGEAAEERAPSERPSLHHGEVAGSPWGFSCRVDLDANDRELIDDFDRGLRGRGRISGRRESHGRQQDCTEHTGHFVSFLLMAEHNRRDGTYARRHGITVNPDIGRSADSSLLDLRCDLSRPDRRD